MDESDAAYAMLLSLERTLTDARGRLADLVALASSAHAEAGPALVGTDVLPPAEELCADAGASAVPEPLVLPAEVDAPPVVLPTEAAEEETSRVPVAGSRVPV